MMHIHRVIIHHMNSVYIIEGQCSFFNKLNMIFQANSIAPLLCVCPLYINTVSGHLKRIGKEKTRYH